MRGAAFPHPDDPFDAAARARTRTMAPVASRARLLSSPARAARETAAILGDTVAIEPALADIDQGDWAGRPFDAIDRRALAAWIAAPEAGVPGGEALASVVARVAAWLAEVRNDEGTICAVTHASVIRAALAAALGIPAAATLAIDIAPLSVTRLSYHDRWRLQELRRA